MARPTKTRKICMEPAYDNFGPDGIRIGEKIVMTMDEYEVIRLVDLEKLTHEQCAKQMKRLQHIFPVNWIIIQM